MASFDCVSSLDFPSYWVVFLDMLSAVSEVVFQSSFSVQCRNDLFFRGVFSLSEYKEAFSYDCLSLKKYYY